MRQIRARDEATYHSLRGLILQIAANPEVDNETKFLKNFGGGRSLPVYADDNWWIVYRVTRDDSEELFSVTSIRESKSPPNVRL